MHGWRGVFQGWALDAMWDSMLMIINQVGVASSLSAPTPSQQSCHKPYAGTATTTTSLV